MASSGVNIDDFAQILSDYGRVVSYKVVTITQDAITGSETTSFATAGNVTVVFFLEDNRYIWDKEGLLEVGDAYIIAPLTVGINRYDQFTIDGETYYIENITKRTVLKIAMADYGVCFKVG